MAHRYRFTDWMPGDTYPLESRPGLYQRKFENIQRGRGITWARWNGVFWLAGSHIMDTACRPDASPSLTQTDPRVKWRGMTTPDLNPWHDGRILPDRANVYQRRMLGDAKIYYSFFDGVQWMLGADSRRAALRQLKASPAQTAAEWREIPDAFSDTIPNY